MTAWIRIAIVTAAVVVLLVVGAYFYDPGLFSRSAARPQQKRQAAPTAEPSPEPPPPVQGAGRTIVTTGSDDWVLLALAGSNLGLIVVVVLLRQRTNVVASELSALSRTVAVQMPRVCRFEHTGLSEDLRRMEDGLRSELARRSETVLGAFRGVREPAAAVIPPAFMPSQRTTGMPVVTRRSVDDLISDYCAGGITHETLISWAQSAGVRWGSGLPIGGQHAISMQYGKPDHRILLFERDKGSSEYLLVLRDDAFWNFDLELVFSGRSLNGGPPTDSRNNKAYTRKPTVARLEGDRLTVTNPGAVEVIEL